MPLQGKVHDVGRGGGPHPPGLLPLHATGRGGDLVLDDALGGRSCPKGLQRGTSSFATAAQDRMLWVLRARRKFALEAFHEWDYNGDETLSCSEIYGGLESLLGGVLMGRGSRRIRAARADIRLGGTELTGPAILLDVLAQQAP